MTKAIEVWAQFGLAGLVIGALFLIVFMFGKHTLKQYEKLQTDHRGERSEWRETTEKNTDKLETAMREISISLQNLKN